MSGEVFVVRQTGEGKRCSLNKKNPAGTQERETAKEVGVRTGKGEGSRLRLSGLRGNHSTTTELCVTGFNRILITVVIFFPRLVPWDVWKGNWQIPRWETLYN